MSDIQITIIDTENYKVTVVSGATTTHEVSVQTAYAHKLTAGRISTEELVKRSFVFLIMREPNTSILRRFDLSVIAHYFPEYEREIVKHI